jgi:hypothetical protein
VLDPLVRHHAIVSPQAQHQRVAVTVAAHRHGVVVSGAAVVAGAAVVVGATVVVGAGLVVVVGAGLVVVGAGLVVVGAAASTVVVVVVDVVVVASGSGRLNDGRLSFLV